MHLCIEALRRHFAARRDVFIASGLALYCERAPARRRGRMLVPDVMVALGASPLGRQSYRVWEDGCRVPQFVLEVASKSTKYRDLGFKKREYECYGVREYWQLDQTSEGLLPEQMLGHRLVGGRYQRLLPVSRGPHGTKEYRSEELGLLLRAENYEKGWAIMFRDPETGQDVPVARGMDRLLIESRQRTHRERQARIAAEERAQLQSEARIAAEGRARAAERQIVQLKRRLREQELSDEG